MHDEKALEKLTEKTRKLFHAQGAFEYVCSWRSYSSSNLSVTILRSGVLGSASTQRQGTGNFTQVVDYGAAISASTSRFPRLPSPDFIPSNPLGKNDVFEIVNG